MLGNVVLVQMLYNGNECRVWEQKTLQGNGS